VKERFEALLTGTACFAKVDRTVSMAAGTEVSGKIRTGA